MTVAYFDASALIKLFIEETGSDDSASLWDGADLVVASRIAIPEVQAALAAAQRAHRIDARTYRTAIREWERHREALRMVELTSEVALAAGDLAERHALGGLEAIHLASAALFVDTALVLGTWDVRLLMAARSEGIPTLLAG